MTRVLLKEKTSVDGSKVFTVTCGRWNLCQGAKTKEAALTESKKAVQSILDELNKLD